MPKILSFSLNSCLFGTDVLRALLAQNRINKTIRLIPNFTLFIELMRERMFYVREKAVFDCI